RFLALLSERSMRQVLADEPRDYRVPVRPGSGERFASAGRPARAAWAPGRGTYPPERRRAVWPPPRRQWPCALARDPGPRGRPQVNPKSIAAPATKVRKDCIERC